MATSAAASLFSRLRRVFSSGQDNWPNMSPTVHDIYHTAWLLRQKLDPDLVPQILEYAGFYDERVCERKEYRVIEERNAPATCLITPALESNSRLTNPIRTVTFRIVAKDQGWASDVSRGSWTWFTAAILKSSEQIDGDIRGVTQERRIVKNPVAKKEYTTHEIVWSVASEDPDEAAWVNSLQSGDRIVVRAWAKYGGWMNFITAVEVKVSMVVVSR